MSIAYSTSAQVKRTAGSTMSVAVGSVSSYALVFVAGAAGMVVTSVTIGSDTMAIIGSQTSENYKIMAFGVINSETGTRTITINGNTSWYGAHAIVFDGCSKAEYLTGRIHIEDLMSGDMGSFSSPGSGTYPDPVAECNIVGWDVASQDRALTTYGNTILGSNRYGSTDPTVTYPPMSSYFYRLSAGRSSFYYDPDDITSGVYLAVKLSPYVPFTARGYILQ